MAKATLTWTQSQSDFAFWSESPSLTAPTRLAIRESDIVLVPQPGFSHYKGPVFPVKTEELFRHLRENVPAGMTVELAVEDVDYKELSLHSELLIIATLLVKWVAAPVAVGLVKDYIQKRLGKRTKNADVRFNLIVDATDADKRKTAQISYEGPAETFESSLKDALKSFPELPANEQTASKQSQRGKESDARRSREIRRTRKGSRKRPKS